MQPAHTSSRRLSIRCRICDKELSVPIVVLHKLLPTIVRHSLVFCQEHQRQFAARRREGVGATQLSTHWRDMLANWRERPAELDLETKRIRGASQLFFSQRYEDWLLFRRSYITYPTPKQFFRGLASLLTFGIIKPYKSRAVLSIKKGRRSRPKRRWHRMGDSLAVNTQTGEIRRFVDINESEVLDDWQGIRPARGQAESASFWGDPTPTGRHERLHEQFYQRVSEPGHRLLIPKLVGLTPFSLYGPIDNPLDLVLNGAGWGGGGSGEIESISFDFSSPRFTGTERNFDITTSTTRQRNRYYPPENDEQYISILDTQLFQHYRLSDAQREQAGPPAIWRGELPIEDEAFSGEVRSWPQPYQLARFTFKNDKTILGGHACGLTQDELLQLLKDLTALNQREDTLAQYQREFDEARARHF